MPRNDFAIRPFEENDLGSISHLRPEGWDDLVPRFEFYLAAPFCFPVAGMVGRHIAAVGCAIVNGATGWIAHIIVDAPFRSGGFGRAITEHCIDDLESRGCETQLLVATALGEPLYKKLGFATVSTYNFYRVPRLKTGETDPSRGPRLQTGAVDPGRGPRLETHTADPHIEPLLQPDLPQVYELDRELMGETRRHVLEWFNQDGWGYFDGRTRDLRGFFLPRAGEGLIAARDAEAGCALLAFKHSRPDCKSVLPAANAPGNEFLEAHEFEHYLEAPRMLRGKPVAWKPRALFSRIGGWYG
jgi:GNAT superfamily N-acetyltransferase